MTYCAGILVDDGLVMIADTRTNAGIDNVAVFRKLNVYHQPDERVVAVASSGNLGVSQAVVSLLTDGFADPDSGETQTILSPESLFDTAALVGRALREVYRIEGVPQAQQAADFGVSFLLGGQIKGRRMRLFQVYSAGNFIEATDDTPYLQIGEHKYGKPILDRAITHDTDLYDALKLGLISMDSTMRSNIGVGAPIDIMAYRRDALAPEVDFRIEADEPYFHDLRESWSQALRAAHQAIPRPPYGPASRQ
ncbi:MAG TPA: peptidase [Hyphomicrobiales bacterium]|nr:peptidase [Hyphomicrobiales bacterium]